MLLGQKKHQILKTCQYLLEKHTDFRILKTVQRRIQNLVEQTAKRSFFPKIGHGFLPLRLFWWKRPISVVWKNFEYASAVTLPLLESVRLHTFYRFYTPHLATLTVSLSDFRNNQFQDSEYVLFGFVMSLGKTPIVEIHAFWIINLENVKSFLNLRLF